MAVSRTPKSKADDPIFSQPMAQIFEDVDNETKSKVDDDRVAELEKALKELREKHEEERSDALLTQPSNWQSQTTENKGYTEVNPSTVALPDPALDPDGFSAATTRRAEIAFENKQRKADADRRFETDIDNKTSELWADFEEAYPDIFEDEDHKEKVDYIATSVVKTAVKKGLDINRYMFGTGRTRFMKDVAAKYEKLFGEPETDEDHYQDNPRSRRNKAYSSGRNRNSYRDRQEDDEGRSAGVFGGNESGGRPNRRDDEETGPSMIDDIHALQRKTGFM